MGGWVGAWVGKTKYVGRVPAIQSGETAATRHMYKMKACGSEVQFYGKLGTYILTYIMYLLLMYLSGYIGSVACALHSWIHPSK